MTTTTFEELYGLLKTNVASVAKETFNGYLAEAKHDGSQVLESLKENLRHWAGEVENGALTAEDLKFLLESEEALTRMIVLKQAGLAAEHIDAFKNGLINMIIGTVTGLIKI